MIQWAVRSGHPSLWLGDVGWIPPDPPGDSFALEAKAWFCDVVEQFVVQAAAALEERPRERPPLLAMNLVGTGEGGARDHKGFVFDGVFDMLERLTEANSVDVVVVCWSAKDYSAAQRARARVLDAGYDGSLRTASARWGFSEDLEEIARYRAEQMRKGKVSIFVGAGVSAAAGLPTWAALLHELNQTGDGAKFEGLDDLDPRDQAVLLERAAQRDGDQSGFLGHVADRLTADRYALAHGLITSLPVTELITTNFDELLEMAARSDGRDLSVIPFTPAEADRWLLKLHGTASEPESLVFTRSGYLEAPRQRSALFGLVRARMLTRHMLFVGYSLSDEDFHEVVHDVRLALEPRSAGAAFGTAITLFDDDLKRKLWEGDVDIVSVTPPGSSDVDPAMAGRQVERLLDLLGFLVADHSAFLLDDDYEDMLTSDELELKRELLTIADAAVANRSKNGWSRVADLLDELGRPGDRVP